MKKIPSIMLRLLLLLAILLTSAKIGVVQTRAAAPNIREFVATVEIPSAFSKWSPGDNTFGWPVNPHLEWLSSTGATSYEVCYDTSNDNACSAWVSTGLNNWKDLVGLTPGATYYWQVRAINLSGTTYADGTSTAYWSFTLINAPSNVLASDGTYSTKVEVSWVLNNGATFSKVYRATTIGGSKTLLADPAASPYADTSAIPGRTYYYWVINCNNAYCSDYSTPNTGWMKLSAPANLLASDGTATDKVSLTWTASSGATSYKVYRATSFAGAKTLLSSPVVTTFADTSATPGVTYYYWIQACRGVRCSVLGVYNTGWRALAAPANLQASDGTYTTKVQLAWTASAGATFYKVYRATIAGVTKTLLSSPTAVSYADISATPGITYYYWVKACRSTRCSVFSIPNTGWRKP
jgi:fibronectin type 3 domain-containing protein